MLVLRRRWLGLSFAVLGLTVGLSGRFGLPGAVHRSQAQGTVLLTPVADGSRLDEYWSADPVSPEPAPISASRARQAAAEREEAFGSRQMSPEERAERFPNGPEWNGQSRGANGLSQQQMMEFSDFPVLFTGTTDNGWNLQSMTHEKRNWPSNIPQYLPGGGVNRLRFTYGTCRPDSDGSCSLPAHVVVQPACSVHPSQIAGGSANPALETLESGAMVWWAGHTIALWTGPIMVTVDGGWTMADHDAAFQQLRPANYLAEQVFANGLFLPPDFSGCG